MLKAISLKPEYFASKVVTPSASFRLANTLDPRSSAKSISPRRSAWAIESLFWNTRNTSSSTLGTPL